MAYFEKLIEDQFQNQVWRQVVGQVGDQVEDQFQNQVWNQVRNKLNDTL